jgi:hypothetical protein
MSKMLRNLASQLGKASAFAQTNEFSPDTFVATRLAPDMRPLSFQVQSACDAAKFAGARLTGVTAPTNPDTETTLAELEQRIAATLEVLDGLKPEQFDGGAEREVTMSFLPGQAAYGVDYLREMALPNFYFHVTTAYALLRTAGVKVGKMDFIGSVTLHKVD